MARFFQTAPTQFVEDFIYQPPWQLIQQATALKQQEYDSAIANANIFKNLQIKHANGEDENYNVNEIQRYYGDGADSIVNDLKNNGLTSQAKARLEDLSRELMKDYTSGNIFKIQSTALAKEKYLKDMEKQKLSDPLGFAAGVRQADDRWGGNSIKNGIWNQADMIERPDFNKLLEESQKLTASSIETATKTPRGGYLVNIEGKQKELSKEQIMSYNLNKLLMDNKNLAWMKQQQGWGVGNYFNKETGAFINPFNISDKGEFTGWNNESSLVPFMSASALQSYRELTNKIEYSSDGTAMSREGRAFEDKWNNINRNDRLIKEEKDRIDAANKSKEDKINAYKMKLAEANIAGDQKGISYWGSLVDNLEGNSGIVMSNLGSKYKTFNDVQVEASKGNKEAQKIVSEELNPILKNSGINFKDPLQKKAAEKLVGLIKQNKLDMSNISEEIKKIIPNNYSEEDIQKEMKQVRLNNNFNQKLVKPFNAIGAFITDDIPIIGSKLLENGGTGLTSDGITYNKPSFSNYRNKQQNEKSNTRKSDILSEKQVREQAIKNLNSRDGSMLASQASYTNLSKQRKVEQAFKDIDKTLEDRWKNKSQFSTPYETAPLSIATQSAVTSAMQDPQISGEWFIEKEGKNEVLKDHMENIVSFNAATAVDGYGRNGLVAIDNKGNQYRVTANQNTPAYISVMNRIKNDVNPNTELGMSIRYPTISRIQQISEGSKRLGNKEIRQEINVKGSNFTIVGNANNGFYAIDSAGNITTGLDSNRNPIKYNYVELGRGLENTVK